MPNYIINPTAITTNSPDGRFLRGFLIECKNRPERHVIAKDVEHEHWSRKFKLTHSLHRRDSEEDINKDELPRYYVEGNGLGKGAEGRTAGYLGCIHPFVGNELLFVPGNQSRLFKDVLITSHKKDDVIWLEAKVNQEIHHAKKNKKLKPKPLFTLHDKPENSGIFYSMRKANGEALTSWLLKETEHQKKALDPNRLIKASIALIQALYLQVSKHNDLHRDIKPDNIFIDEGAESEFSVTIIDYGFATDKLDKEIVVEGTPAYLAPEYKIGRRLIHDLKFDVYSLARVLAQVWGDGHKGWIKNKESKENKENKDPQVFDDSLERLFEVYGVSPLVDLNQPLDAVKDILSRAQAASPNERLTLDDLYSEFLNLHVKSLMRDVADAAALRQAHHRGLKSRGKLEVMADPAEFMAKLATDLKKIDDHPPLIREYINGLGWDALKFANRDGVLIKTRADLLENAMVILKMPEKATHVFESSILQLSRHMELCQRNLAYFKHLKSYEMIYESFKQLVNKCTIRNNAIRSLPLDLDEIIKKTHPILNQFMELSELHDLIHLKVRKPNGGRWKLPGDWYAYQAAANEQLTVKMQDIVKVNPTAFNEITKADIDKLLALTSEEMTFEQKRERLIRYFSKGKHQKHYIELCKQEKKSPVHSVESYITLITSLETIKNKDMDGHFLKSVAGAIRDYLQEAGTERSLRLLKRAASNTRLAEIKQIQQLILDNPTHEEFFAGLQKLVSTIKTGPLGTSLLKSKLTAVIKAHELTRNPKMITINVEALYGDEMALVNRFLKHCARPSEEFNQIIFAGQGYEFEGKTLEFDRDLILLPEKKINDGARACSPQFGVVTKGALYSVNNGEYQVFDIGGVVDTMHSDKYTYHATPNAEVLHIWSQSQRLPKDTALAIERRWFSKVRNLLHKAVVARMNAFGEKLRILYTPKRVENHPLLPTAYRGYEASALSNSSLNKRELQGVFIRQKGTTLANYLDHHQAMLTPQERLKLTAALLKSYQAQVMDGNKLHTHLSSNAVIVALNERGEYKADFDNGRLHSIEDNQPEQAVSRSAACEDARFLHPDILAKMVETEVGLKEIQFSYSQKHDLWSLMQVLCDVWGVRHPFFDDAWKDLLYRARGQYKQWSYSHYNFAYHEAHKFSKSQVDAQSGLMDAIDEIQPSLPPAFVGIIKEIKSVLKHNGGRRAFQNLFKKVMKKETELKQDVRLGLLPPHPSPMVAEPGAYNQYFNEYTSWLAKATLFTHPERRKGKSKDLPLPVEKLPMAWRDLLDLDVNADSPQSFVAKWPMVHDALKDSKPHPFTISELMKNSDGNPLGKQLFNYLSRCIKEKMTRLEAGHRFVSGSGSVYGLPEIRVRQKGMNADGSPRYYFDVYGSSIAPTGSKASVPQLQYVLKPTGKGSLYCENRNGLKVAKLYETLPPIEEINKEVERLARFGSLFKPKLLSDGAISMKKLQGKPIFMDAYAALSNTAPGDFEKKWRLSLALTRAVYMHPPGMVHGDLMPANILLAGDEDNPIITLIDYEPNMSNNYSRRPQRYSPDYIASEKDDRFALGIMLAHLWGGMEFSDLHKGDDKTAKAAAGKNRDAWLAYYHEEQGRDSQKEGAHEARAAAEKNRNAWLAYLEEKKETRQDEVNLAVFKIKNSSTIPKRMKHLIYALLPSDIAKTKDQAMLHAPEDSKLSALLFGLHQVGSDHNNEENDVGKSIAYMEGCSLRHHLLNCKDKDEAGLRMSLNEALHRLTANDKACLDEFIRGLGFSSLIKKMDNIPNAASLLVAVDTIFKQRDAIVSTWQAEVNTLSTMVTMLEEDLVPLNAEYEALRQKMTEANNKVTPDELALKIQEATTAFWQRGRVVEAAILNAEVVALPRKMTEANAKLNPAELALKLKEATVVLTKKIGELTSAKTEAQAAQLVAREKLETVKRNYLNETNLDVIEAGHLKLVGPSSEKLGPSLAAFRNNRFPAAFKLAKQWAPRIEITQLREEAKAMNCVAIKPYVDCLEGYAKKTTKENIANGRGGSSLRRRQNQADLTAIIKHYLKRENDGPNHVIDPNLPERVRGILQQKDSIAEAVKHYDSTMIKGGFFLFNLFNVAKGKLSGSIRDVVHPKRQRPVRG